MACVKDEGSRVRRLKFSVYGDIKLPDLTSLLSQSHKIAEEAKISI